MYRYWYFLPHRSDLSESADGKAGAYAYDYPDVEAGVGAQGKLK